MKALGSQEIISVHWSPLFPKPSPLENQPKLWLVKIEPKHQSQTDQIRRNIRLMSEIHTSQQSCAWRNWYHWGEIRRSSPEEKRFQARKASEAQLSAWIASSERAWTSTISCCAAENASPSPLSKEIEALEFDRRIQNPISSTYDYGRCFSSSS